MATSKDDLAEYLECGICLEKFKEPKVLSCQHLYCKKCLERLVTRDDQGAYEITCPECRQKSKVPNGDVSGLPSNYVINHLLSKRSDSKQPSCEKHEGEILVLFCQRCDQLICRDCALFDHRLHKYSFVKDIFPAEKEKITKILEESKVKVCGLQTSIETLKEQEDSVNKNLLEVNHKIDSLIEKQIKLLEQERQTIKDELRKLVLTQKNEIQSQIESFASSLASAKTSVEVIEQTLSKGSKVDVLSTKNEMIQQLTNLTTENFKPRGKVSYNLETNLPLYEKTVGEMVKIREYDEDRFRPTYTIKPDATPWAAFIPEYDEDYELTIKPDTSSVSASLANFIPEQEALISGRNLESTFYIRSKRKSTRFEVKIKSPDQDKVYSPLVNHLPDGSIRFSYHPRGRPGDYEIEIVINGRCMQGSPFTWEVN